MYLNERASHWKNVHHTVVFAANMPFHHKSILFAYVFGSHGDTFTMFDSGQGKQFSGFPSASLSATRHLATRVE